MTTWKIIFNVFMILVIVVAAIGFIVDYREHKDDESISPGELKRLRRSHFKYAMFISALLLFNYISRFFNG